MTDVVVNGPPAYTQHIAPPPYTPRLVLPAQFLVGPVHTTPLVSLHELRAHLRILGAFHALKSLIVSESTAGNPEAVWIDFLRGAVGRFAMWLKTRTHQAPPLDVLMVWHAYLLNPVKYAGDSRGAVPELAKLGPFPWDCSAAEADASDYSVDSEEPLPHFALDLVGAVQRQAVFVEKMAELRWADDENALMRAIARYHAFLDVMTACPGTMLVPTLDIDLAWHTHQLKAAAYRSDTIRLLGKVLDHDDTIESGDLSNSLQLTAMLWQERFGIAYSGCVDHPFEKTAPKVQANAVFAALIADAEYSSGDCGGGCGSGGCGGGCGGGCRSK